jgi:hypothetical protein
MPNWRSKVGGKTLTASALGKRKIIGKITAVSLEILRAKDGSESERLCLQIEDERKVVPMNVGNCENLSNAYGEDYDNWEGKPVVVSVHKTKYAGKPVDGLLVMPLRDGKKK